jgi:monovalent cation:H+ antiporter, CPA1 family
MDILLLTTFTAILFLLIAAAEPLAARLSIPFSVMLAAVGILIGGGAIFLLRTELTDTLNPVAESILSLPIRSSVFMYVFLPTLIFQATLEMNIRRMLDDWVPILTLAVVAVVAATLTIGFALSWIGGLPLMVGLLIGAIVSTTDPSAVVSIFRSLSAPKRLARIVEGESLLNDAAAIALFGLFMSYVMLGVPNPSLAEALGQFPALILGGVVAGWLVARVALLLMGMFARFETAQISVSVAVPYLAYIGAEQILGASAGPELHGSGAAGSGLLGEPARNLGPSGALGGGADLHPRCALDPAPPGRGAAERPVPDRHRPDRRTA